MNSPTFRFVVGSALLALAPSLSAQTIAVNGTVTANSANTQADPLAVVSGITYYPYTSVSAGNGSATAIGGFSSLVGVTPSTFTYAFTSLNLTAYAGGGPGDSVETYTPGGGSTFTFSVNGTPIASGEVVSLTVTTGYSTGTATALGYFHLTTAGSDPAFYNEVSALTGGTNILTLDVPGVFFDLGDLSAATFHVPGTFSVTAVPEPATVALGLGLAVLATTVYRRRTRNALCLKLRA
jgi:hypothetical protein